MKVIILRGPSGSGKTTWQKKNHPTAWVCSADSYFMKDGYAGTVLHPKSVYDFDPRKLPEAHALCMETFLEGIKHKEPVIVVDNTNTRTWEWDKYKSIAELCGYEVDVLEFLPKTIEQLRMMIDRNEHNVPLTVIAEQALRFESHPDSVQALVFERVLTPEQSESLKEAEKRPPSTVVTRQLPSRRG